MSSASLFEAKARQCSGLCGKKGARGGARDALGAFPG